MIIMYIAVTVKQTIVAVVVFAAAAAAASAPAPDTYC